MNLLKENIFIQQFGNQPRVLAPYYLRKTYLCYQVKGPDDSILDKGCFQNKVPNGSSGHRAGRGSPHPCRENPEAEWGPREPSIPGTLCILSHPRPPQEPCPLAEPSSCSPLRSKYSLLLQTQLSQLCGAGGEPGARPRTEPLTSPPRSPSHFGLSAHLPTWPIPPPSLTRSSIQRLQTTSWMCPKGRWQSSQDYALGVSV